MMDKRHLLMYYDKQFQKDPYFPLIACKHKKMKKSTTAGYLTAERESSLKERKKNSASN